MQNDRSENQRISQGGIGAEDALSGLLDRASEIAGGVLSSIQAVAGTTACKGVQLNKLKEYAIAHECWYYDPLSLLLLLRYTPSSSLFNSFKNGAGVHKGAALLVLTDETGTIG
jgi:hypothetical protein